MMVCVSLGWGAERGRSLDRMGELRGISVRVKRRGVGLLGLETELRALALSHSLWQFGGFTLSCSALFVCAPLSVSHVKVRPHCPLVTVGDHSSQNQGKDGHWQLGPGLQTWGARHLRGAPSGSHARLRICLLCFLLLLHFFDSVNYCDRVTRN